MSLLPPACRTLNLNRTVIVMSGSAGIESRSRVRMRTGGAPVRRGDLLSFRHSSRRLVALCNETLRNGRFPGFGIPQSCRGEHNTPRAALQSLGVPVAVPVRELFD